MAGTRGATTTMVGHSLSSPRKRLLTQRLVAVSLFSPTSSPLVLRVEEFVTPTPEVVLFVGFPASGKTSLYKKYFAPDRKSVV